MVNHVVSLSEESLTTGHDAVRYPARVPACMVVHGNT